MSEVITNMKVRFGADTTQFKKGMDDGKKAVKGFQKDAGNAMEQFANQFGVSLGPLKGILNSSTNATKALSTGMKGAASSGNIFTSALKLLKVALISTGIGALVVALGSLISYFTQTQRGADGVKKVMAGFKSIINVLIDRLSAVGEGLFKIFTGKFQEGWDALKQSVKGVADEIKNEAAAAYQLEAARQKLRDSEIALIEVQAQRKKEIAAARLLAEDETVAAEKRLEAIKRAQALEQQTLNENKALQVERIRIMQQEIDLGESTADEYRALAEEKAKLFDIESESLRLQKRLQTEVNNLTNEIEKETAAIIKQREEQLKGFGTKVKPVTIESSGIFDKEKIQTEAEEAKKAFLESFQVQENIKLFEADKLLGNLKPALEQAKSVIVDFATIINDAFETMAITFAESIGELISGSAGFDDFGKNILGALGGIAVQAGKIIMKAGIAFFTLGKAFQIAISNPATALLAVAAGAALVAVGSAVQSSLKNAASGGSGGTFSSNAGIYDNTTGTNTGFVPGNYSPRAQIVQVEVTGKSEIKHDHILLAYNKARVINNITG